jgi:putative copper export protein
MDFVLWVCRVMHVISAVVWVGGLIFLNAVIGPVIEHEQQTRSAALMAVQKRFFSFVWMSLWTMLATGILLMLMNPQFRWFDYSTPWQKLLVVKELSFLVMAFFSWQMKKVFEQMELSLQKASDAFDGWRLSFVRLVRRSIVVALIANDDCH